MLRKNFMFFVLLAFPVLIGNTALASTRDHAGIAAIVNDDVITVSDMKNRVALYLAGGTPSPEARRKAEAQVLDKLIDERLELKEATALGITVDATQINEALAEIARQNGFSADEFKKRLTAQNINISTLNDQIRAEIAWSQVIRRKLRPKINISESEIDAALEQLSRGKNTARYHVAEIFLNVATPADEPKIRASAQRIVTELSQGISFAATARQFSQAPGAAQGGDLGWVQEGQIDAKLATALKKMEPGQISPLLRTEKGYHILFLQESQKPGEAVRRAASPVVSDAIVTLKQILIPASAQDSKDVLNAKLASLQVLAKGTTSCDSLKSQSKSFTVSDLGKGPLAELPPQLKKLVENLKAGQISQPLFSDKGIVAVMLCSRETATPPPPEPADVSSFDKDSETARTQIANKLGMQRLEQMQDRYLRDLRTTAFIDKRL